AGRLRPAYGNGRAAGSHRSDGKPEIRCRTACRQSLGRLAARANARAGAVAEEEESVLAAFDVAQRRWRRALLVLAPRKPERFGAAAEIAQAGGWEAVRRSRL